MRWLIRLGRPKVEGGRLELLAGVGRPEVGRPTPEQEVGTGQVNKGGGAGHCGICGVRVDRVAACG